MVNGTSSQQESTSGPLPGGFTRRAGAKALVTSGTHVLLVRERHVDGSSFWTLPGGGVCAHESPTEGLRRELVEELRCQSRVTDPVSTFWYVHESLEETVSVYTVFECSLLSEPVPNHDEGVFESRWVDPESPPPGTLPQVQYVCENAVGTQMVADN